MERTKGPALGSRRGGGRRGKAWTNCVLTVLVCVPVVLGGVEEAFTGMVQGTEQDEVGDVLWGQDGPSRPQGSKYGLDGVPDEFLEDLSVAHPSFNWLLRRAEANASGNASGNGTGGAGGNGSRPSYSTPLVGTAYSCVSANEYRALAMDRELSKESNQYTDGTFFCDGYVDYAAACDLAKPKKSCNNKYAHKIFEAFTNALSVYSCKEYSAIWTCKNCKLAYKRWLCSQIYRKFVVPDSDYVEFGTVSQSSPRCQCPYPSPTGRVLKVIFFFPRFCGKQSSLFTISADDPNSKDAAADKNPVGSLTFHAKLIHFAYISS
jgi:hypothetical protein